jgi:Fe-S cluster assembly iron-binding protein IscA
MAVRVEAKDGGCTVLIHPTHSVERSLLRLPQPHRQLGHSAEQARLYKSRRFKATLNKAVRVEAIDGGCAALIHPTHSVERSLLRLPQPHRELGHSAEQARLYKSRRFKATLNKAVRVEAIDGGCAALIHPTHSVERSLLRLPQPHRQLGHSAEQARLYKSRRFKATLNKAVRVEAKDGGCTVLIHPTHSVERSLLRLPQPHRQLGHSAEQARLYKSRRFKATLNKAVRVEAKDGGCAALIHPTHPAL